MEISIDIHGDIEGIHPPKFKHGEVHNLVPRETYGFTAVTVVTRCHCQAQLQENTWLDEVGCTGGLPHSIEILVTEKESKKLLRMGGDALFVKSYNWGPHCLSHI